MDVPATEHNTVLMERDQLEARVVELTKRPPRWLRSGARESHGDGFTRWWVFPPTWSLVEIARELHRWDFDTTESHCHHSYDCCGRWYCHGLTELRRTASGVLVGCSWYRNV
jgi:hypothetical protein